MTAVARRRGAPSRIDLETVVQTALQLVDEEGFEALSLRSVAARTGVVPPALYRYVAGAEELFDMVVERIVERTAPPYSSESADWRAGIRDWARYVRRVLSEHPAILAAACRRPIVNLRALREVEQLVAGPLGRAGLDGHEIDAIYRTAYSFVVGFVSLEQGRLRARQAVGGAPGSDAAAVRDALAGTELPTITAAAEFLAEPYDEAHFETCLGLLCAAVETRVRARDRAG